MLLRLVPPAPLPTILFTLVFPTLPQSLPLPTAWEHHLQLLVQYQLAEPPSLHALDKSVAWTALLDTVTFDLVSLTVSCVFVDGVQEEWPLTNHCVDLLESVIRDVNRSASEAEAEHELERRKTDGVSGSGSTSSSSSNASLSCAASVSEQSTPIVSSKAQKPKKRRSILASLMASFVPSTSFSGLVSPSRVPTPPPPPPPPPPPIVIEDLEPLMTNGIPASRFLRRRARSTLVDAYRRFVVRELGARFQTGEPALYKTNEGDMKLQHTDVGVCQTPRYALWATRSTMRRVADEMARVIDYALYTNLVRGRHGGGSPADGRNSGNKEDEPNKDDDKDADDSGSASSMTDGSSVHTPLDFHDTPIPFSQSSSLQSKHHILPSHTPTVMTPQAYHAYVSLKDMHHRLHGLACQLSAEASAQEQAATAEAGGAEVRSRRRAWSSRQYLVGSGNLRLGGESGTRGVLGGASMAFVGLAVPVRSSPLCRGWSAEELEADESRIVDCARRVRWQKEVEHGREMMRRARSLNGELSQRGRCYFGTSRNGCEVEDVHGIRRSALDMNPGEEGPFGLVYSTGPRYSETKHDVINEEEEEEDDEDKDNAKDVDEDGDHTLYEKRSQEEFILQAPQGSSALLRAWSQTQLKTPQPTMNKATVPKDSRPGRSMPITLMTPKLLPTAAVAIEEFPTVSETDPVCVVNI